VAAAQRSPSIPDVPTVAEAGLAGYEVSTWYAMWAPAGTPQPVVDKMIAEVTKALNTPKIKEIWAGNGSTIPSVTGAQFGSFVDCEIERRANGVKHSGVTLD